MVASVTVVLLRNLLYNFLQLQGPLNKAQGFALPLKIFAAHVHEGQPEIWTYLEDELFIEMNPELRDYLGQPVSTCTVVG